MEQHIVAQFQRLPGLKSSLLGLETLMGTDEDIEFDDYLNDPEYREGSIDVFTAMENRLGDKPVHIQGGQ